MHDDNTENFDKDSLNSVSTEDKEELTNDNLETSQETDKNLSENKDDCQERIEYLENQLKLSVADFSNYKKRVIREQENISFQENSKIILEFLSFKETLQKAISHEQNESSKKNLEELNNNFDNILSRLNIKKIDLQGKDFDYNLSECIQTLKVTDKNKNNKVIEVLENGYTFKEKLIKPGKVIIGQFMEE